MTRVPELLDNKAVAGALFWFGGDLAELYLAAHHVENPGLLDTLTASKQNFNIATVVDIGNPG